MFVNPSSKRFDIALQKWREEIGEYNGEYIASQEKDLCAIHLSCEELNEVDF